MELPKTFFERTPWENETNPIWPASSFILHRNVAHLRFPSKMSPSESDQVIKLIQEALNKTQELSNPLLFKASDLSPLDKEFLYEHFLCPDSFQNTLSGQAFIVDDTTSFLGLINIQDHLQLEILDTSGAWEKTYNRLMNIETSLGAHLEFAFSSRFGYLTSDPSSAGTALTVSFYLHLPALIHTNQLGEILLKQKEEEIFAHSMQGPIDDIVGDLIVLSNQYTLGLSEENILQILHAAAMKLMAAEKTVRSQLSQENNAVLKDQVSRAYGLLIHSYQLQGKEALSALSLIKLGAELGWIEGVSDKTINKIFFQSRRAHLAHLLGEKELDPKKLPHQRASFFHEQLHAMQLKI